MGMRPSLALLKKGGFYGQLVADLGVPVFELNQKSSIDFRISKEFVNLAKLNDCVHFQCPTPTLMIAVGRSGQVPSAYTHRGGELRVSGKRRAMHYVTGKLIARYIDAVSGNTRHAANCARSTYRLPHEEVLVTYNGIDFGLLQPKRSKENILRELGEDPAATTWRIGTSANLRKLKRVDLLIKAVANLHDKNVCCYVIGDGPARQSLQDLAIALDVSDQVKFLGMKEHIGDYLQILDGFALLSDQAESFGNSAVEAMGLGIPTVIMANGGGMVEHFPDDCAPLPKDLNQLTEHIRGWIQDREQAKQSSLRYKTHVIEKYTLENMVRSFNGFYETAQQAFRHKHP